MAARNEKTSKKVAAIAGKVLAELKGIKNDCHIHGALHVESPKEWAYISVGIKSICTIRELKILAASCLTQTADKPKSTTTPKRKRKS